MTWKTMILIIRLLLLLEKILGRQQEGGEIQFPESSLSFQRKTPNYDTLGELHYRIGPWKEIRKIYSVHKKGILSGSSIGRWCSKVPRIAMTEGHELNPHWSGFQHLAAQLQRI
uniref:Uncharacterized protein n=1 Tax=Salix viminalis TaxID=40686 RepID=A0A6N2MWW3_SALVM